MGRFFRIACRPHHPPVALGAAVLLATACLYLQGLGRGPLLEPDEGRYAEIPREMLVTGDWVVPRLNGVVYAEKPPLVYWLTALSYRVVGVNELGARLVPAVSGVLTVGVVAWFGMHCFGPAAGWAAAIMLATMPLFFLFSRLAILDVPITLCVTLGTVALYRVQEGARWRWQVVAGLAMAAGVLVKGVIAILFPVGIVAVCALFERDGRAFRRALSPLPLALALLLPLPWFWLMVRRVPGFLQFFFVEQHFYRFTDGGKIGQHHRPGVLAAVLFGGALPWSLVLVAGLVREGKAGIATWRLAGRRTERLLDIWLLAVLGFFSLSSVQLATYICPAFVPLALRAGRLWSEGRGRGWPLVAWATLAGAILMAVAAPGQFYDAVIGESLYQRWWPQAQAVKVALLPAAGVVLGATLLAAKLPRPGEALVVMAAGLALGLARTERSRDAYRSYPALGAVVRLRSGEADRLVTFGTYLQSLPFYARRRTAVVGSGGELHFGAGLPDGRTLLWSEAQLIRAWNGRRRLLLVIEPDVWRRLRHQLTRPPSVLALEHRRVLVTNALLGLRPPPVTPPDVAYHLSP